ncbi:MAG: hypothetical protein HY286_03560 [Planctomycetes bacterium]|nr:hypothetical protein [Planctomycetota bacterium]
MYRGRLGVVIAMRAALGASGFKPFVEDKLTKIIDPFITGGNALEVILLAPREDGPAIRKWFNDMEGTPGSGRTGSGSAKEGN